MGKLQHVVAQLAELSPEQVAPFQQRCQEAEEQYGHLRGRVGQAAAVLDDALPRYSQVWPGTGTAVVGWHALGFH